MSTAKLTSKGQLTLPKDVRDALKLRPGDQLEFIRQGDTYVLRPRTKRIGDFAGLLHKEGMRPVGIEDMNEGIAEAAANDFKRSIL